MPLKTTLPPDCVDITDLPDGHLAEVIRDDTDPGAVGCVVMRRVDPRITLDGQRIKGFIIFLGERYGTHTGAMLPYGTMTVRPLADGEKVTYTKPA